ncbi:hypothetical protein BD560DRAFT_103396 [Blakeslea trispora]|nr:hypothetical protein BD560DRAFT_103396 [Blakeslea trispora]
MIEAIPFEVIDCISQHLTKSDFYQLIFVSHIFHRKFIPFLYNNIYLHGVDPSLTLLKKTQYHRYIKHIKAVDFEYGSGSLEVLQSSLIQLQSLDLEHHHGYEIRRLVSFFRKITTLSIRRLSNEASILSTLLLVRRLRSLSIHSRYELDITPNLIRKIHSRCSLLESLSLECNVAPKPDSSVWLSMKPVENLKHLTISVNRGMQHFRPWLNLIGSKYPQLTHLTLENYDDWSSGDLSSDESKETTSDIKALYHRFLMGCSRLKHFQVRGAESDPLFLEQLQLLKRFSTRRVMEFNRHSQNHLLSHPDSLLNLLSDLSITLADNLLASELLLSLSQSCSRLERLEIGQDHSPACQIQIDLLLFSLPCLTSLTLHGAEMFVQKRDKKKSLPVLQHKIREMHLIRTCMNEDIFAYLNRKCTDLSYLNLTLCHFATIDNKLSINLSNQKLKVVHFNHPTYRLIHSQKKTTSSKFLPNLIRPFKNLLDLSDASLSHDSSSSTKKTDQVLYTKSSISHAKVCMTIAVGSIEFTCQSLDALFIDGKRKILEKQV